MRAKSKQLTSIMTEKPKTERERKAPQTRAEQEYWRAVRLLALKRDNYQCQNCGEEVIEIKEIGDWKGALGKILADSSFFPNHNKRHLFGKRVLAKLALAQTTCCILCIAVPNEGVL